MEISQPAEEINEVLKKRNSVIYELLSNRGKSIIFPHDGILNQSAEAKGKKINATIGIAAEDDCSPMRLKSIAEKILIEPHRAFTYAPSQGVIDLRKKWQEQMRKKNPSLDATTTLPMVTGGLTHALSMAGYLFMDKGDKVIMPDMFWGNYKLIFGSYGAKLNLFRMFKEDKMDLICLQRKLKEEGVGKKIVMLNFPNNPTGYTPTEKEAKEIVAIIKESAEDGNKILVILDDAYFGLVYEKGIYTESLFSMLATVHKNVLCMKIDGPTKEDYVWGFRVGFITFSCEGISLEECKVLEDKTAAAIRATISNASHLSQSLLVHAYHSKGYAKDKKEKYEILKSRFDKVKEVLSNEKYGACFRPLPYNSGYFMCIQLEDVIDSEKVRKILLEKYDTGVISLGDNLIRITFASVAEKDIELLFDNVYDACKDYLDTLEEK